MILLYNLQSFQGSRISTVISEYVMYILRVRSLETARYNVSLLVNKLLFNAYEWHYRWRDERWLDPAFREW